MKRSSSFLTLAVLTSLLGGCPPTTPPLVLVDTGIESDAGPPGTDTGPPPVDAGPTDPCAAARTVTLAATGVTTATGNTTGRDMSLPRVAGCGGANPAPQEVIAITLPGVATELTGVRFSLVQAGTADVFDTVVELRTMCSDAATGECFDDAGGGELRSAGTFAAEGGATRFLVVSGYNPPYAAGNLIEGPWEMEIEVATNQHAPTLTAASVLTVAPDVRIGATGMDTDGDIAGVLLTFLDAAGAVVAIDLDMNPMTAPLERVFAPLRGDVTPGTPAFDGYAFLRGVATLPAWANVVSARVVAVDSFDLESAAVTATAMPGTLVALGGACDATTNVCNVGYRCVAAACAIPASVTTACGAATALVAVPGTPTSAVVTVPAGAGLIPVGDPECTGSDPSGEALVDLTIPAGTWDVTVTTAGPETDTTDTIVFLASSCGDPATEIGCNDDVTDTDYASLLEVTNVAGGDYTLAVEVYDGAAAATMVDITVRLREVLATGATCDPSGDANRCATGTCPGTGTPVCP